MNWTELDTWIVVVGALAAGACALPGSFLLLRRLSLMGDAISHAVLPGLALAFLFSGSRSSGTMFLGAAIVGILTAAFTQWIHGMGRVDEGASMGVVFTSLFAVGLILIVQAADAVDLDPGCVLYGSIELTPLDRVGLLGFHIPRAAVVLGSVFLVNAALVLLLFKEMRISSFDAALATTMGIRSSWMHYGLMTATAVTTVAAFEAVGSILVIAMLIVPAATAHLLTDRLPVFVALSVVLAAASACLGHVAAITIPPLLGYPDTNTAGMIATAAGAMFFLAMFLAPIHGILPRTVRQWSLGLRIVQEDCLALLRRIGDAGIMGWKSDLPRFLCATGGQGKMTVRIAIGLLRARKLVRMDGSAVLLTSRGSDMADSLARSNQLWKQYVAQHFVLAEDHVGLPAERVEHFTGPKMEQQLSGEERSESGPAIAAVEP